LRSGLIALVLALCAGLMLAGVAIAGGAPWPTDVTIKEENGDFHGKVKSEGGGEAFCIADRKVTVFKKRDGADKRINSDTTDEDGKWNTGNTHVGPGKYYAKAKAVFDEVKQGPGLICEKGKSPVVRVN
jgi:hypothetical protein